jgi:hypothetical protein
LAIRNEFFLAWNLAFALAASAEREASGQFVRLTGAGGAVAKAWNCGIMESFNRKIVES